MKVNQLINTTAVISAIALSNQINAQTIEGVDIRDIGVIDLHKPIQIDPKFGILDLNTDTDGLYEFNSGAHFSKKVLTETRPHTASPKQFTVIPGAKTSITVQPGSAVLVNLSFTAESSCRSATTEDVSDNWCEVRLMVGGREAYPQASANPSDTFAFDSTDRGSESNASWEAHAMDRHLCIRNTSKTYKTYPITAEWKVTDFSGNGGPKFWIDDWSLTIEQSVGCRQRKID